MSLPTVSPHKKGKKDSNTVAERVAWMSRTSDIFGSYMKTDMESYLSLIRRKIQEKCSTTQDLIYQIRRTKVGESAHVTPNEFRFTLIKFGIILPQPLVDKVFNIFDSDRSGTMDFDEFAMWIMNSEFRPVEKSKVKIDIETPEEILRKKILQHMQKNPNSFSFKKQVSYFEFVSDINRLNLGIADRDARNVFVAMDPYETGFISADQIKTFIHTGKIIISEPKLEIEPEPIPLVEAMVKVSGSSTKYLELCFSHIPIGKGVKMPFEEFRRCLLSSGMGKSLSDTKQLFNALGGKTAGGVDIDLLREHVRATSITTASVEPLDKKTTDTFTSTGRADRKLRDAMRKVYPIVTEDIQAAADPNDGYINASTLHQILLKKCLPLSFQDFRLITQQLKTKDGGSKVSSQQFLRLYNPNTAPHPFAVQSYAREAAAIRTPTTHSGTEFATNEVLNESMMDTTNDLGLSMSSSTIGKSTNSNFNGHSELRRMWQAVLKECHRSDPDRSGNVSRKSFIAALEAANIGKSMSPEAMNKLADEYTYSNGLVDYLACFRTFLNGMVNSIPKATKKGENSLILTSPVKTQKQLGALHPWEFDYKREFKQDQPYWQSASSLPRDVLNAVKLPADIPSASEKPASNLSMTEKELLLKKFEASALNTCSKCYKSFHANLKDIINDFKRRQIISQKGCIMSDGFREVLGLYDVKISKAEMGNLVRIFRGFGMPDVVRYDEFLRVCLIVKGNPSAALNN